MPLRLVMMPIDDISALLRDYASGIGYPPDAKPVTWLTNPAERKLALVVEAESLTRDEPPEEIRFTLRETFAIGGNSNGSGNPSPSSSGSDPNSVEGSN